MRKLGTGGVKYCWGCDTEKSVTNFNNHRSNPDGLQVYCNTCRAFSQMTQGGPPTLYVDL